MRDNASEQYLAKIGFLRDDYVLLSMKWSVEKKDTKKRNLRVSLFCGATRNRTIRSSG